MNVLSLFDGMSCGQIALQRAAIHYDKYFASEIEKNAIKITQKNYPNTIQIGDVTKVRAGDLPKIDLLIGGSPCQGFSFAGKGLNFDDPRSKLFFEYVRLLNECRPTYFMLENVNMKKEFRDIISSHLGVEPVLINSASFSAQDRKRYYWTNILINEYQANCITLEDILEEIVDDKYYISTEAAVYICEREVEKRKIAIINSGSQGNRIYDIYGKSIALQARTGGHSANTGIYAMPILTPDRLNKRQNGRRFRPPFGKSFTLTAQDRHGVLTDHSIRRLTPIESERLQTVPDNYTASVSDTARYRMLGNGWTVDVIAHIFKGIKAKE